MTPTTQDRTSSSPPAGLRRLTAVLGRLALGLLELAPLLLVGLGAGLVYLPAGPLLAGLLWWWADQREAAAEAQARLHAPHVPPPRVPRGPEP